MPADYRILGPLEARLGGRPVALGPRRHKALLVLLLIRANTFVAGERLIDELWGEDAPATAHNLVQGGISSLRKALGREAIETRGTAYALRVPRSRSTCTASSGSPRRARWRSPPSATTTPRARWARPSRSGADRRWRISPTRQRSDRSPRGSTSSICSWRSATCRPSSVAAATRRC